VRADVRSALAPGTMLRCIHGNNRSAYVFSEPRVMSDSKAVPGDKVLLVVSRVDVYDQAAFTIQRDFVWHMVLVSDRIAWVNDVQMGAFYEVVK
jgi:hypothetical protein